jgi:hypothetical protein
MLATSSVLAARRMIELARRDADTQALRFVDRMKQVAHRRLSDPHRRLSGAQHQLCVGSPMAEPSNDRCTSCFSR